MDVSVREEDAADDEVILFTEANDSFSVLLLHPIIALMSPSKSKTSCHGTSSTVICSE